MAEFNQKTVDEAIEGDRDTGKFKAELFLAIFNNLWCSRLSTDPAHLSHTLALQIDDR